MSNTFQGGLESTTLPDTPPSEDNLLPILDDDIEVSFVDDPAPAAPAQSQQRRGQNEDDDEREAPYASSDLDDIENPRIKDRIMRERRLREEAESRANQEIEKMEEVLLATEKQKLSIQRDAFKLSLDGVDIRIKTAREALKMARQDGDTNAETDIEAQLSELTGIRGNIESQMGRLLNESDLDRAYKDHVSQRRASRPQHSGRSDGVQPLNDKAGKWKSNNGWMDDSSRTAENAALLAINNQLVKEGYDAKDDQFFTELSRRMAKSFPSLGVKDLAGRALGDAPQRQTNAQPRSAPVAGGRPTAAAPAQARANNPRQIQLDKSDAAMMRIMRIDTSDKKAVQYYAKMKYERLRNEQKGA